MDFRAVSTKSRIIGLLAILAVGFLILRSGDEPSDSDHQGSGSESTTDRHFQPREPTLPTPGYDYGIVGRPGARNPPRPYGGWGTYPEQSYPGAYRGPPPYAGGTSPFPPDPMGGYRFRPLTEREHKRRQTTSYPDHSATPYHPPPRAQSVAPTPSPSPPLHTAPPQEVYSFRPPEKSPGAHGRWQGPYTQPGRRFAPSPMAPSSSPPHPQWGATPPAQHMYPNLYRNPGCRLTAR